MGEIDKFSDRPACRQMADDLRGLIKRNVYSAGQRLPSPAALARDYGVHISTARRAVAILRSEGLVKTVHRAGSVVMGAEPMVVAEITGPARVTARMPSQRERQELRIAEGVPFLIVERASPAGKAIERYVGNVTVLEIPEVQQALQRSAADGDRPRVGQAG